MRCFPFLIALLIASGVRAQPGLPVIAQTATHPLLQPIPIDDQALQGTYPFINTIFNRVNNSLALDSFFHRLYRLKMENQGKISVVHIGDSHIQADFLSDVVRDGLQENFGNGGRGLVFPYQLAGSNAPGDIVSSSNIRWQFNRLAHPEINLDAGISGFVLRSAADGATINVSLRPDFTGPFQSFDRLRFFTDSSSAGWLVDVEGNDTPFVIRREEGDTAITQDLLLGTPGTSVRMATLPGSPARSFYGVSMENGRPGVVYHTIGVNGARYDQYNATPLFWKQLPALNADLYIVSMGTNEAQRAALAESVFIRDFNTFIARLRAASPKASILITTAPDSYKGRYSNRVLRQLNETLVRICDEQHIAVWDLYKIGNGFGSAYSWSRRGLMSRDRIHFTATGYRIQGRLLFNAIAKSYNNYLALFGPKQLPVN